MSSFDSSNGITLRTLLEYIQGMKYEILIKVDGLESRMSRMEKEMHEGFKDARVHRTILQKDLEDAHVHRIALQEDLEATILLQAKHEQRIARMET